MECIGKLSGTSIPGPDGIPVIILPELKKPMHLLLSESVRVCVIPSRLKIGIAISNFQKG